MQDSGMRRVRRPATESTAIPIEDQGQVAAWSLYNFAAHGWAAPVAAVLIGPWMLSLATNAVGKRGVLIAIGPAHLRAEAYPSAMLTVAAIVQFLVLPLAGAAADLRRAKRRWLAAGCAGGSMICVLLALTGGSEWLLVGLLFVAGAVLAGLADLMWNGMLPEIAGPERRNAVSSRATAMGYLGAGVILVLRAGFIDFRHTLGLSKATAVRLCFLIAGIWWAAFGAAAIRHLDPPPRAGLPAAAVRPAGAMAQLGAGYRLLRQMPQVLRFIVAYLCFGDAVSAVIALSSTFLTHQLFNDDTNEASTFLFALILMVQFVAIGGALCFARLAARLGTKRAVRINLVVWFSVIVFAYAILDSKAEAVVMGVVIGLALGGATALARSMFAQMIPRGSEATFFGLFEVCSQGTSWLAPLIFTIVVNTTGSFRQAILSLIIMFILGFVLMWRVDLAEAAGEAQRASPSSHG